MARTVVTCPTCEQPVLIEFSFKVQFVGAHAMMDVTDVDYEHECRQLDDEIAELLTQRPDVS